MKKFLIMTLICCLLISSISAFATAEKILINGSEVTIPEGMGRVCEKDDRTFVPIRFITEYLGCIVNYQEPTYSDNGELITPPTATITNPDNGTSYFVNVGDNRLFVISSTPYIINMDTTVFVNNDEGRMYVPVRFLAEALGYDVDWEEETQTVILNAAE